MIKLDKFDIAILETLQTEGRMTKLKLSEKIGLSLTPCFERVKKLEKSNIIKSYRADIDLNKVTDFSTFFVTVVLGEHRANDFQIFENKIKKFPEIVECYALAGGIDYIMKVVDVDIKYYQNLIDEILLSGINIAQYYTYIITKAVIKDRGVPIQRIIDKKTP